MAGEIKYLCREGCIPYKKVFFPWLEFIANWQFAQVIFKN